MCLSTTFISLQGWRYTFDNLGKLNDMMIDEEYEINLSSALLYLWEGAIPLMTAYCDTYMKLKANEGEIMLDKNVGNIKNFKDSVMVS